MSEMCSFCDKTAILTCPDCGWEVCEEHSREDGKCIYCTKVGVKIDQDKVDLIVKLGEGAERGGEEGQRIMREAWEEFKNIKKQ